MEFNPIGSTAASLGSALGQGIAAPIKQAMDLLGQKKLLEIQNNAKIAQNRDLRNRREQGYKQFLPNLAGFLADQSDAVQKTALENLDQLIKVDRMIGQQMQGNQGQMQSNPMQMQDDPTDQRIQQLVSGQTAPLMQGPMQQQGQALSQMPNLAMMGQQNVANQLQQQNQQQVDSLMNPEFAQLLSEALTPESKKLMRAKDARDQAKFEAQQKQFEQKQDFAEKKFAFEQTKKFREETKKQGDAAKLTLAILGRQRELNNSGKLASPLMTKVFRDFGIEFALSPESQEFAGLEKEYLKGVSKIFGGRVSNFEVQQFLRGIPTLMQSKEGRDRIIRNLEIMAKVQKLRANAMDKILNENKTIPLNIDRLVENKIKNKSDLLLDDFKTGAETYNKKPNPQGNENKLLKTPDGFWERSDGKQWNRISQEEVDKLINV